MAYKLLTSQLDYVHTLCLPDVLIDVISQYIHKPLPYIEELKQLRQCWLHRIAMHDLSCVYYSPVFRLFIDEHVYYSYDDSVRDIGPEFYSYTRIFPPSLIPPLEDVAISNIVLKYPSSSFCKEVSDTRDLFHCSYQVGVILDRLSHYLRGHKQRLLPVNYSSLSFHISPTHDAEDDEDT